jgi:hypothetical protein
MYGLRTVIHLLQGFLDSLRYYLVGVNGVPLIWNLLCVDHSLFCNTLLSGVIVEVGTGVLLSRSGLLCWTVCVVSSICLQCPWRRCITVRSPYMPALLCYKTEFRDGTESYSEAFDPDDSTLMGRYPTYDIDTDLGDWLVDWFCLFI